MLRCGGSPMGLDAPDRTAASDTAVEQDVSIGRGSLRIRCASCGALLMHPARLVPVGGTAMPVFVNPAGMFFELLLVDGVVNAFVVGPPTMEATWFAGYAWRCAVCRLCARHVGWRWDAASAGGTRWFCGLIRERIVVDPNDEGASESGSQ
jgi:hypothetical protein